MQRTADVQGASLWVEPALSALFDIVPDAVLVAANGRWIYANPAAVAMLGYESERELIGRPMLDLVPSASHPFVRARVRNAMNGTCNPPARQNVLRADGSEIMTEARSKTISLGPDTAVLMVVMRDITARIAEEARFTATFEQEAVGMAHIAFDGRWLCVNHRLTDLLGYTLDELMARTLEDLLWPADRTALDEGLEALARGDLETLSIEMRIVRRDGMPAWVHVTMSLASDANGLPAYLVAVFEDIEERRIAMQRLATATHEFNNVLAAADAFATVLRRKNDPSIEPVVTGLRTAISRGKEITRRSWEADGIRETGEVSQRLKQ